MKLIKTVFNPLRVGIRIFKNKIHDLFNAYWRMKKIIKFRLVHGYWANLEHPKTFSEKLLKRIISDIDPEYDLYSLKHFAQYFVRLRDLPDLKLAKQLKVTTWLQPSDFDNLPESFVIKSSFGSGLNLVVLRKSDLKIKEVCDYFNLRIKTIKNAQNRVYPHNCIVIEAFIGDPRLGIPNDFKFHCFNSINEGFTCLIQVDSDRYGLHRQTILDRNFSPVEMQFAGQTRHEIPPTKPNSLEKMLRIAEELSIGFDYIRIDLFDVEGEVFFGEITPFHQGAMAPIKPREWDYKVGEIWKQRIPFHSHGTTNIQDHLDQTQT